MNKGPNRLSPAPQFFILHAFSLFFPFPGKHYGINWGNLKDTKLMFTTYNFLDPQQRIPYSCPVVTMSCPLPSAAMPNTRPFIEFDFKI
jgi:hypothetical protein